MSRRRFVLLDRDGTLIVERITPDYVVDDMWSAALVIERMLGAGRGATKATVCEALADRGMVEHYPYTGMPTDSGGRYDH